MQMDGDSVCGGGRRTASPKARARQIGLVFAAFLPGALKRWVYRWCFGYRISPRARIGVAFLDCDRLTIADDARIAHGAVMWRCGDVHVGRAATVGPLNLFRGGERIHLGDYTQVLRFNVINAIFDSDCTTPLDSSFILEDGAVVTAEHRIDFTDRVRIGRCSILGGRNSSIWTHNIRTGRPVEIGDHCYVGSEIRMAPGARIPDCCIVGLGSVVTEPLSEPYSLIAGVPARARRSLNEADREFLFGRRHPDMPESPAAAPLQISAIA
jgi:acetyltransferase-like isoleucine patch superfamily enzyme